MLGVPSTNAAADMQEKPTGTSIETTHRRNIAGSVSRLAARALVATVFLAGGFAGLTFLHGAERIGANRLQVDPYLGRHVLAVAIWCALPLGCMVLLTEIQIHLARMRRLTWQTAQWLLPVLFGSATAFIAFDVFPQPEFGPKQTLLVIGGACVGYLGSAVQLALWRAMEGPRELPVDFPAVWYAGLVLLGAAYFGAMHGWLGDSPELAKLLVYREQHWVGEIDYPKLTGVPLEDAVAP